MRKRFRLVRCVNFGADGIGGVLTHLDGDFTCLTLELPWRDNHRYISCIPAGSYLIERKNSMRFGSVVEVKYVSGRSDILFHSGNVYTDTNGCILLGKVFGKLYGLNAVLTSRPQVAAFAELVGDEQAELEIINKLG